MSEPLDLDAIKARYLGPGFDDAHHPDVTIAALVAEAERLRAALVAIANLNGEDEVARYGWKIAEHALGERDWSDVLPPAVLESLGAYSVPSSPEEES